MAPRNARRGSKISLAVGRPSVVRIRAVHRLLVVLVLAAQLAHASPLAESIDTSGDSITRGFDANTSSRNYATGVDHGSLFCSSGGTTFSHAERLECAKGGPVTNFNDAESGADMLN